MRHILRAQEAVGLMAVSRMCLECSRPEFWFLLGSLANHQAILIAWLQDTNSAKDEYMSKVRLLVMAYALVVLSLVEVDVNTRQYLGLSYLRGLWPVNCMAWGRALGLVRAL